MSSVLLPKFSQHPTEELLEEYHFGRVSEPLLANLEVHLLVCVPCQNRLREVDRSIAEIRSAAALWERDSRPAPVTRPVLRMPAPVLATAMAAGLVGAVLLANHSWRRPHTATPSMVRLVAMRGASNAGVAQGPLIHRSRFRWTGPACRWNPASALKW